MHVIGTAGHVDHGKSSLVHALTGIDPDRLKEEKEREMTIDLGYAWLTLPSGESVSVVDVPGHEDFIRNMLAGVGGIDAAILVIAADDGVMLQTREHLAILDKLKVRAGLVALTKVDLVDDAEWLEMVRDDIGRLLAGTNLRGFEILPVSSKTGQGLPHLVAAWTGCSRPPHPDSNGTCSRKEGVNWGALKPSEHLFIFNRDNYTRLMQKAGFARTEILPAFDEADGNFSAISFTDGLLV